MAKHAKKAENSIDIRMYYRARAKRQAVGLTQDELATLVGVSNVTISLYERGYQGSTYDVDIMKTIDNVWNTLVEKYGYWYDAYLNMVTGANEVKVWADFEGHVPENIIRKAKEAATAFASI